MIGALLGVAAAATAVMVFRRPVPVPPPHQVEAPGSLAMANRLAAIADAADTVGLQQAGGMVFGTNQPHLIPELRRLVGEANDPLDNFGVRVRLAAQLLQAGFSKEALQELDQLGLCWRRFPPRAFPESRSRRRPPGSRAPSGLRRCGWASRKTAC